MRCACGLLVWLCWMRVEAEVQQEPVRVAAVGDVLFGRYLERPRPSGPIYSPVSRAAQPFAQVAAVLQAADLAFANLETPVLAEPAVAALAALSLADGSAKPSLADEIAALAGQDKIDEELEAMKRALGAANEKKED